ncbi:MAG: FGGY family carbohydrate kinase [Pseudomonadota bacterium]
MSEPLYLALDQGGHSSRALVLDAIGNTVAKAQVPIHTNALSDVRIEHKPKELVDSLQACCNAIAITLGSDTRRIQQAGLATQRSSIVCWQRSDAKPLTPVLSWQDRRAANTIARLSDHRPLIESLTGLAMSPHYGASKLHWCLDNEPSVKTAYREQNLTIGPLASFLARALTGGDDVCDPANASRTLLWNRHTRGWSKRLCALFDIDMTLLPSSVPTRYPYGDLSLGDHRVPLALLTGDQSAAIYAFGAHTDGAAYINLGTGAFMQVPIGAQTADVAGLLNSVVFEGNQQLEYVLEGTVNGAGRALSWWSERHGSDPKTLVGTALDSLTHNTDLHARVPVFLNGVSGLGSPYWLSEFNSQFIDTQSGDVLSAPDAQSGVIAILDSIVFLLNANLEAAAAHTGALQQLILTGGLATVDYLCQSLADISGSSTARSTLREATAKGVGFLLSGDTQWPGPADLTTFEPGDHLALRHRHSLWVDAMQNATRAT